MPVTRGGSKSNFLSQIAIFNIFRMLNPNLGSIFDESQRVASPRKLSKIPKIVGIVAFSAHSNAILTIFGILANLRGEANR